MDAAVINNRMIKKGHRLRNILYTILGFAVGLVFISPLYILFVNSLKTQKGIYLSVLAFPNAQTFSPANYTEAFEKLDYIHSFFNSLVITVVSTALIILVSAMAAWVLVRYKNRFSKTIFMIYAASMLVPFQCVMLPLIKLSGSLGMLNPIGLIIMYIGFGTSMSIIMFHGFIKNIPEELEEAATIDGCSSLRLFFTIVFPMMKTIVVTVAVLNIMWIWNDYLLPSLVINKPGWQTLPLKTYLFFGQFSKRWDLASAGLILCMVPIILFYLFAQKYIVKGVTDGAIK